MNRILFRIRVWREGTTGLSSAFFSNSFRTARAVIRVKARVVCNFGSAWALGSGRRKRAAAGVQVLRTQVQTRTKGRVGPEETLAVIRSLEAEPRTSYTLSHAPEALVPTTEIARAHSERHRVEETLQEAEGEVGWGTTRYALGPVGIII